MGSDLFILAIVFKKIVRILEVWERGFWEIMNIKLSDQIIRDVIWLGKVEKMMGWEIVGKVFGVEVNGKKREGKFYKFVHFIIIGDGESI